MSDVVEGEKVEEGNQVEDGKQRCMIEMIEMIMLIFKMIR
jgi:hypothetical protein